MKSELDKLREQRQHYEQQISSLEDDIEDYKTTIYDLENQIEDLEEQQTELDTSTIDKAMMLDKLKENWHLLTMSDIDAICKI